MVETEKRFQETVFGDESEGKFGKKAHMRGRRKSWPQATGYVVPEISRSWPINELFLMKAKRMALTMALPQEMTVDEKFV